MKKVLVVLIFIVFGFIVSCAVTSDAAQENTETLMERVRKIYLEKIEPEDIDGNVKIVIKTTKAISYVDFVLKDPH